MSARLLSRLIFLAASFLLVMVMFAPTQALAHAGHDHRVDTSSKPTPVKSIVPTAESSYQKISSKAHIVVTVDAKQGAASEVASGSTPSQSKNCSGGCCQSAGANCCPITLLLTSLSVTAPEKPPLFPPIVSGGAGIIPAALSRPPRSPV